MRSFLRRICSFLGNELLVFEEDALVFEEEERSKKVYLLSKTGGQDHYRFWRSREKTSLRIFSNNSESSQEDADKAEKTQRRPRRRGKGQEDAAKSEKTRERPRRRGNRAGESSRRYGNRADDRESSQEDERHQRWRSVLKRLSSALLSTVAKAP